MHIPLHIRRLFPLCRVWDNARFLITLLAHYIVKMLPERCLIVGPSWVGDMVMAQSLFMALKERFPALRLDVLAPAWSEPLLERMPEVTESICMPIGHGKLQLGLRYQIGKQLRKNHYDWAILLPNSLKSALIPFWAKVPQRTGFKGEMRYGLLNDLRQPHKDQLTQTVQRFVALALPREDYLQNPIPQAIPTPRLLLDPEHVKATAKQFGLLTDQPVLALCPGAEYGPAKRWPIAHFAEVARTKLDAGWQVWVFGSEKDNAVAEQICDQAGHADHPIVNLAGRTSLAEAIDLMSLTSHVISNDSGLMHVAAALEKPLIALYGSSDPTFTPPLNDQAKILSLNLACSPCFKRECPLGHLDCLTKLMPKDVLDHLADA